MPQKIINFIKNFFSHFTFHVSRCQGFTLAEVLITLGIIGVVAAITIPILQKNIEEAQFKTAYKKAYSDVTNIWQEMRLNNEIDRCPSTYDSTCSDKLYATFKKYINVSKSCADVRGSQSVKDCWDISGESFYEIFSSGGVTQPTKPSGLASLGFLDISGRSWSMVQQAFVAQSVLLVDTNGFKLPNKFGKDRFAFYASPGGIGTPLKIVPAPDRKTIYHDCGYPPCYGTSWLYK